MIDWHDDVYDRAASFTSTRRVQPLTTSLIDLIVESVRGRRPLQFVSGSDTLLTEPAHRALADAGRWVVREGGSSWDGHTGEELVLTGSQWAGTGSRSRHWINTDSAPTSLQMQVIISISQLHPAVRPTKLGELAQLATRMVTGQPLVSWGASEPTTQVWDSATLTDFARRRTPQDSRLVAVGPRAIAEIRVGRTSTGVEENVSILATIRRDCPRSRRAVQNLLTRVLVYAVREFPTDFAVAHTRRGRADLLAPPRIRPIPEPAALALGSPAVLLLGEQNLHGLGVPDLRWVERVGSRCLVVGLGRDERSGWLDLAEIVRYLGQDAIHAAAPDLIA